MVTKAVAPPMTEFPDAPPREDMQNVLYIYEPGVLNALWDHLQRVEDRKPRERRRKVFVMSEMPVRPVPTRIRTRFYVPDLTVAFDVDESIIVRDNGFAIAHQDGPPALVLEVASKTTGDRDVAIKRDAYAGFSIREYWRTDPSGGDWHGVPLAGDRLGPDGKYVPIPIRRIGDEILRGYSEVLGLHVCWEHGMLRFFDPAAGRYLLTQAEEREGRLIAEAERDAAEAERDKERESRLAAEDRARRLEEQLRRLQG